MMKMEKTFVLNNGTEIPAIGFGTYRSVDNDKGVIAEAVRQGYRHFDTAAFYFNEDVLGKAVKDSGIPRSEFFITSKVWREELGYEKTCRAFEDSLSKLDMEYVDLYLIHWPRPIDMTAEWEESGAESFRALEEFRKAGKIRAIGVSNFLPHHLDNLMERTGLKPAVDQLEFHPGHTQQAAVDFAQRNGIQVEAWSPMGRGRVMKDELLLELAGKYEKSVAQICIRFALQNQVLPLPKSSSTERMRQNLDVFDFSIDERDMYRLLTMPPVGWSGEHPDREWAILS